MALRARHLECGANHLTSLGAEARGGQHDQVIPNRMTADVHDFVVFIIGMRINKPWKIHKWLPVFLAMPRMLKELEAQPDSGFLGCIRGFPVIVQYWRSFEHLESYARSRDLQHWPAWMEFNKRVGSSRGDVGIWHETYLVPAGQYETFYSGMPPYGLGEDRQPGRCERQAESARERFAEAQTIDA